MFHPIRVPIASSIFLGTRIGCLSVHVPSFFRLYYGHIRRPRHSAGIAQHSWRRHHVLLGLHVRHVRRIRHHPATRFRLVGCYLLLFR